jgi:hypothetical protein
LELEKNIDGINQKQGKSKTEENPVSVSTLKSVRRFLTK